MKIGLLSYRSNPYSGGQGIYIRHLSKALSKLGHEVSVISGQPYPELDDSINLIKLPGLGLFESGDRFSAFKISFFWNLLNFYEWFTVMTGGFPEPYAYGRRAYRLLKKTNFNFWVTCFAAISDQSFSKEEQTFIAKEFGENKLQKFKSMIEGRGSDEINTIVNKRLIKAADELSIYRTISVSDDINEIVSDLEKRFNFNNLKEQVMDLFNSR